MKSLSPVVCDVSLNKSIASVVVGCAVIAGLCSVSVSESDSHNRPTSSTISIMAQATNTLAFDLYKKLNISEGNVFFSPFSIETALLMTYEGARGQTADEMGRVLHIPSNQAAIRASFSEIQAILGKSDKAYTLTSVNALWTEKIYSLLTEYQDLVKRIYRGEIAPLDFKHSPSDSRKQINAWVTENTKQQIKELIPADAVNEVTRLILTNAIYFKGIWQTPFDKESTRDQEFRIDSDHTIQIPTMKLHRKTFPYYEDETLQAVEMPYAGDELSLFILLPKHDAVRNLETRCDATQLDRWKHLLRPIEIDLRMPRFKFESKHELGESLQALGMPTAFTMAADFSGITGHRDLVIGHVIHQAVIDVNEAGSEASAATAVIMPRGAVRDATPRPLFNADHPFIFLIQEKSTGTVLFLGKVVDPR